MGGRPDGRPQPVLRGPGGRSHPEGAVPARPRWDRVHRPGDGPRPVRVRRRRSGQHDPALLVGAAERDGRRRQPGPDLHGGRPGVREGWLTIGIEEEYQIVDADGALRAHIDSLVAATQAELGEMVKPEFLQSVVEVGTNVCTTVGQAREEIVRLRGTLAGHLATNGLRLASAGTHPFSKPLEQLVTEQERYRSLEEEMQDVIRELLIFGLHVHVGIPDPELRIEIMNEARYFLPHLLMLSTSSPFWLGRATGLKSYRGVIWSRFPRTGIPPDFPSHDEFENYVELLVRPRSIDDGKKIWWDVRPH